MMAKTLIILGSLIWIAFCMRFWWMINPKNVWQRRLIAIMAGAGGGLIYLLGSMIQVALTPPPEQPAPTELRSGDEVRVSMPPKTK
ncbi:MAG: hypothetical protein KDK97_05770 [Verrucomicrobiales bacterium]|nr:hypothetical protein [Verrucomicrobiales bacterium]MCP5558469.1 hypothetical protein [Verrucomicrobiaceae bacterium]